MIARSAYDWGWMALLLVLASMPALAADGAPGGSVLYFEDSYQRFQPTQEEQTVTAQFHFTNISTLPVSITYQQVCSCVSAATDRQTYQPGEHGVITAVFDIGINAGILIKYIHYTTDHPALKHGQLGMEFTLPSVPIIMPQTLWWNLGESPTAKAISIRAVRGWNHRITGVRSSDPRVSATLTISPDGWGYAVSVVPAATETALVAALTLTTDCARTFEAQAVINSSPSALHPPAAPAGATAIPTPAPAPDLVPAPTPAPNSGSLPAPASPAP
jgi:hypothetical protein